MRRFTLLIALTLLVGACAKTANIELASNTNRNSGSTEDRRSSSGTNTRPTDDNGPSDTTSEAQGDSKDSSSGSTTSTLPGQSESNGNSDTNDEASGVDPNGDFCAEFTKAMQSVSTMSPPGDIGDMAAFFTVFKKMGNAFSDLAQIAPADISDALRRLGTAMRSANPEAMMSGGGDMAEIGKLQSEVFGYVAEHCPASF